ncbi:MAG: hypothetical protein AAFV96_02720 [Pseudomonadota bacterium]
MKGQISPLDFGTLLGDEATESEAPPQQSRPFTGFRSTEGNSAEDYRRAFSSEALAVPDAPSGMTLSIEGAGLLGRRFALGRLVPQQSAEVER